MNDTTKENIADARYNICGRCRYGDIFYDDYPCTECVHKKLKEFADKEE